LSHAGIDDRISGFAVFPRLERLVVAAPPIAAWTHVFVRRLRSRGEQLVEEVAPSELAHEGCCPGDVAGPVCDLQRRDAAEVEVRRQARGRVCREIVATGLVGGYAGVQPGGELPPARGLTARRKLGRGAAGDDPGERGQPAARDAGRYRQPPRRKLDRPPEGARPGAVERREHAVV